MSETQRQIRPEQTEIETPVPEARTPSIAPPTQEEDEDFWEGIDTALESSQGLWKHYRQKGGQ